MFQASHQNWNYTTRLKYVPRSWMVIVTAREFESTCNYFLIITVTIAKSRVVI